MDIDTVLPRISALEKRMAAVDGGIVPQPTNPDAPPSPAPMPSSSGGDGVQQDGDRFPTASEVHNFIKNECDQAVARIKNTADEAVQSIKDAIDAGIARIGEAVGKELDELIKPGE